jgi:hypothetical protein
MSKRSIEHIFTGATVSYASYDSTKTILGPLVKQYTGALGTDKFAGPEKIAMARPFEASTAIVGGFVHVIQYSSNINWVFLAENSAAAATRRIIWYEFDINTTALTWKGFITLTYPTATAHTIRGFRVTRDLYTTGTVGVSGTAVTGSSTLWSTSLLSVGSRIGFGSTDPTQITTWYQISAIGSDTTITLTGSAGTISSGTSYVIEDLRVLTSTTNATTTNGGLFVTKGLRIEDFINTGTVIPAATTVDNIKAVYWLADASTVTNTIAGGCSMESKISWTDHRVYVTDTTGPKIYVYNMRAALTLTAGKDTTTNIIKTGNQAVTGTLSQNNNSRILTLGHGPGSGVACLYFATTTRVYRCVVSGITNGSTTWQSDAMVEVPPGSTTTYPLTSVLSNIDYISNIDRLVVLTTSATGARSYITQYNTTSAQFDHIFLIDDKNLDQSTANANSPMYPSTSATTLASWTDSGRMHLVRLSAAATLNQLYTLPIGAHWSYTATSNSVLMTPSLSTSNSTKLYRLYVNEVKRIGDDQYVVNPEPYKMYVRTSGISSNTGPWTLVTDDGDLSGMSPSSEIQFKFEFNTIGRTCIPARILGLSLTYEDDSTDSHYQPSVANSSITTNIFANRQSIAWGSNIPNMRIRLYNAVTGVLILDDNITSSAYGTWQYSSNNGTSWNTWLNTQDVVGNYIRYTATSLPGSTRIKALLTQA